MAGSGLGMTTNLDAFNMQLKETDKLFAAGVKKRLREAVSLAGVDLVSAIKAEASWSDRIPKATSIAMTFGAKKASIRIRVDKKEAPHARGLEFGNSTAFSEKVINANGGYRMVTFVDKKTGKRTTRNVAVRRGIYQAIRKSGVGSARTLRHPVYARGGYASQPTRPFFFASVQARTPEINKKFDTAIALAAVDAGFKGV